MNTNSLCKLLTLFLSLIFVFSGCTQRSNSRDQSLERKFTLPTPWTAEAFNAEVPLSEYPRPQMVRPEWINLNGIWDYMGGKELSDPVAATDPIRFDSNAEKILVPFPPEAELSNIGRAGETNLWYRRNFEIPSTWDGKRILLHFGAVDRVSSIFINGKKAGTHTGGYTAFSLDITDYLTSGQNTLVVGAWDPNDGKAPSGKNGATYTFTSGIWQTVWMEPVEKEHISHVKLTPDLDKNCLEIEINASVSDLKIYAVAMDGARQVATVEGNADTKLYLAIPNPKLWSPDDPFLYGLKLQLKDRNGKILDRVDSYFGMRSVSLGKVDGKIRTLLNGKFVIQLGLLDQGYWPDGIFTAPTDKALLYDIELAKRTGFNVIRKHIKTEPMRW